MQRLGHALRLVPSGSVGVSVDEAVRAIWANCGGPHDEVRSLLRLLDRIGLISYKSESLSRSRAGDRVAKAMKVGDQRPLGLTLIRAGCFHDQARALIEAGRLDENGNFVCPTRAARIGAAQLLGLLQLWEDVQVLPAVTLPKQLVAELNTVWALLPPPTDVPTWAVERKAVGNRAEMYSLQREKTRLSDPSRVFWVARDSDSLGWDIEDRSVEPRRCIEVKGSRNSEIMFFLSENEWAKATELGDKYEVHFWGGIDLARDPAVEYSCLMAAGYPVIIEDLPVQARQSKWDATPVSWRITPKRNASLNGEA